MMRRNPEVDGLRALAVSGVIAYHFYPEYSPGGFLGVDAFFVISGFVVTSSCLGRSSLSFGNFVRQFWARRFWRIYPALFSVVLVGLLMIVLVDPDPHGSLNTAFYGLIGLANIQQFVGTTDYFVEQTGFNGFTHLWSLGVEEQFYLVFPLLFYLVGRKTAKTFRTILILVPTLISVGAFHYLNVSGRTSAAFFLFPFRFWQIATGVLVAVLTTKATSFDTRIAFVIKMTGVFLLCTLFLFGNSANDVGSLVATTVTAVVIASTQFHQLKNSRTLRIGAAIGQRSYSLYLVHWVILVFFRLTVGLHGFLVPVSIALTIVLSEVNYQFVEKRFVQEHSQTRGFKPLAVSALSVFAILCSVSFTGNNFLFSGHRQDDSVLLPRLKCVADSSPRWLVGDSHANGYSNILARVFNGDCLQIRDEITGNFFLFQLVGSNPRTVEFMDEQPFLNQLSISKPRELWIINYLQGFFQDQQTAYLSADWKIGNYARPDGTELKNFVEALDFRMYQYRAVLVKAKEIGTDVFIELPPPDFNWVGQGGLEWHDERQMCSSNWFAPGKESRFSTICDLYQLPVNVSRSTVESRRKHIVDRLILLADEFTNLHLIDPVDALCSLSVCSTHFEGVRVFEDDDHYSVAGEELIAERLMTLIK